MNTSPIIWTSLPSGLIGAHPGSRGKLFYRLIEGSSAVEPVTGKMLKTQHLGSAGKYQ